MKRAKKALAIIFAVTLICAIIYIVSNMIAILSSGGMTSFPWWSPFGFAAIYFGPVFALEGILYGILVFLEKRE